MLFGSVLVLICYSSLSSDDSIMSDNDQHMFPLPCGFPGCDRLFRSRRGRTKHYNSRHFSETDKNPSKDDSSQAKYHYQYHKKLNGM